MENNFDDLKNGVVLAELGGHGDGPYCAEHGAGAALVLMGTYIVDASDNVPYPAHFVFKPGRSNYTDYLREHVEAARKGGAKVGVSIGTVELQDTIDFLAAAEEAGADYVSLCAYSVMPMFTSRGLGVELCRKHNRSLLKTWTVEILDAVKIPFIFKFGAAMGEDCAETVDILSELGVAIIHAVAGSSPNSPGLEVLSDLAKRCRFLIGGGGVTDVESARRILETGAEAVAVATAAMDDPGFLGKLQSQLRA